MTSPVGRRRRSRPKSNTAFGTRGDLGLRGDAIALPSFRQIECDLNLHRICRMIHHSRIHFNRTARKNGLPVRIGANPTWVRAEVSVLVRKQSIGNLLSMPKENHALL